MSENTSKREETPEEHLLRSLRITAISRFIAAKRLRSHEAWSLWSISFASLLLIFVPLFKPFGIDVYLSDPIVNVTQVLAAAVILVFSLLVNASKFGERAELMHSCALSINSISRRLEELMHNNKAVTGLSALRVEYENLLEKHENHSDLDFLFAQIRRYKKYYKITCLTQLRAAIRHCFSYTQYIVPILAEVLFIWLMLVDPAWDPVRNFFTKPLPVTEQACLAACASVRLKQ